ncbi:hypothetical protein HYU13_06585 [Candidatus Woesearchaeota archaeon]|nr:hypothetical protein [Candidatus Woesearchaeota archaeon]
MGPVTPPPQVLAYSPSAGLDGVVSLYVYSNWFLPDHQVSALLGAVGKEWSLREAIRKGPQIGSGKILYERISNPDVSCVHPSEISRLEYQRGRDYLLIMPLVGSPLPNNYSSYGGAFPLGVYDCVEHINDQWLRLIANIRQEDPMFKAIQHAVAHLGQRSTAIVDTGHPTKRFVFDGHYFAWEGLPLQEKLDHARKNPLPGYKQK